MVPSAFDICVIATSLVRVGQQLFELVDQEIAFVVDRRPFDDGAMAFPEEMPGHDVGMVLHDREHDLVAGLDVRLAPGRRHEVDRLGGVAGEDDLLVAPGVEEFCDLGAAAFIGFGRRIGEIMQPAMHVGVFALVGLASCGRAPHWASARRRRCRDRPAACHRPSAPAPENPPAPGRHHRNRSRPPDAWSTPCRQPALGRRDRKLAQIVIGDAIRSPRRRRPGSAAPALPSRKARARADRTAGSRRARRWWRHGRR